MKNFLKILIGIVIPLMFPFVALAAIPTPVSCWNFDESSGNANDAVGSNTLTNNGTATFVAGKINNATSLSSASSQYFSITNASQTGLGFTGDMTLAGWVNFSAFTTNNILISKWNNTGNQKSYEANADGTNFSFNKPPNGNTDDFVNIPWTPSLNTWYFVMWTFNSSSKNGILYVNGSQQGTTQTFSSGTVFNGTATFAVGARQGATQPVNGKMDDWCMWGSTLSAANDTTLYNGGIGLQYPFASAAAPFHDSDIINFQ